MTVIEYTEEQSNTILTLVANLHWDLVREMLNTWTNPDKNPDKFDPEKINRSQKVVDDLQEIESIVKGVPIT